MSKKNILDEQLDEVILALDADFLEGYKKLQRVMNDHMLSPDLSLRKILLASEISDFLQEGIGSFEEEDLAQIRSKAHLFIEDVKLSSKLQIVSDSENIEHLRTHFLKFKSNTVILKAQCITKVIGRFKLHPINLELKLGEITSVVGKNGNGKSTLLKILAGEIATTNDALAFPTFCDNYLNWEIIKQQIAYIPQDLPSWDDGLSIKNHLHFTAASKGLMGKQNDINVNYILTRLGLKKFENYGWGSLSGGYKLRFELARQLVWNPKLLIMDEPLAHLDVKAQSSLLNDLRKMTDSLRYPIAIIMSSQNLYDIEAISDNVIFLTDGKTTYNGSVNEISHVNQNRCYIIGVETDLGNLKSTFENIIESVIDIKQENGETIIKTKANITANTILSILLESRITIKYFRDISNSTRIFFEDEK
jgi:ABC-2 type transport system ATP-binding protein